MLSQVMSLIQAKGGDNTHVPAKNRPSSRGLAVTVPGRRGHVSQCRPQYSPYFFMSLIITLFSSIAFLTILTVAMGAG